MTMAFMTYVTFVYLLGARVLVRGCRFAYKAFVALATREPGNPNAMIDMMPE